MYEYQAPDGEVYGPYEEEQLLEFVKGSRMNGNSLVRKHGEEEEWTPLSQVEDLSYICREAAAQETPVLSAAPTHAAQFTTVDGEIEKPGKVTAIAVNTMVGGILALLLGIGGIFGYFLFVIGTIGIGICFFPIILFPIYSLVLGVMALIKGIQLLGSDPIPAYETAKTTSVMQIVNIICGDGINLTLGILNLVFLNDPEVKEWVRSQGGTIR